MKTNSEPDGQLSSLLSVSEVRYSLTDMLRELKVERAAASFAMEKLDQREIEKLFKSQPFRRGSSAQ